MTKLIMNGTTDERLMTIGDLSEMLGIPIETLYGWRHRGEGATGVSGGATRSLQTINCGGVARKPGRSKTSLDTDQWRTSSAAG